MKAHSVVKCITRILAVLFACSLALLCIFGFRAGIFRDVEALRAFVEEGGVWGPFIFLAVQIIQIIIPFIPGGITLTAGVLVFGVRAGFIYNYLSIILGSTINFLLARRFGKPLVHAIVPESVRDKYLDRLNGSKSAERLFALSILLPLAPDDALCMLAGLTAMPFHRFILILLLCKPFSIALYSLGFVGLTRLF